MKENRRENKGRIKNILQLKVHYTMSKNEQKIKWRNTERCNKNTDI